MRIALINENSQAAKNAMIEASLKKVVEPMGHEVINYGMYTAEDACQLTYVKIGLLACILLALLLSRWIREREACMLLFVFTSVPLLFLSGISWPGSSIPPFWQVVSWLFPSTFGINGFVRINSLGASLSDVWMEYLALWIQAIVYYLIARKRCKVQGAKFMV